MQIIDMKFENKKNVVCGRIVAIKEKTIRVFVQYDDKILLVMYYHK